MTLSQEDDFLPLALHESADGAFVCWAEAEELMGQRCQRRLQVISKGFGVQASSIFFPRGASLGCIWDYRLQMAIELIHGCWQCHYNFS